MDQAFVEELEKLAAPRTTHVTHGGKVVLKKVKSVAGFTGSVAEAGAGYRHRRGEAQKRQKRKGGDPIENSRQRYQGPSYGFNAPR